MGKGKGSWWRLFIDADIISSLRLRIGEICMSKSSAAQNQELIALLKPDGVFFADHLMLA